MLEEGLRQAGDVLRSGRFGAGDLCLERRIEVAHLIFQTAFPGDLFLSIPLIKRVRQWDPATSVVLACRPGLGGFFLRKGLVDEVIEIDKRSVSGRKNALNALTAQAWDWIFVPHESVRTALWVRRLQARQGKVGFRKWWNLPFFSRRVKKPMEMPDALRQLSLLTPIDEKLAESFGELADLRSPEGLESPWDFSMPQIPEWVNMSVGPQAELKRRVFLAPGSVWATKRWTQEGYETLAHLLIQRGFTVELVGSPAEKSLCDAIATKVSGVVNRAGKTTLGDLVDLFSQGGVLVCNDSGAMHAAAIAGLPTVAIFGPTVLAQGFRPWQNRAVVVQRPLECRPCGKHGAKECPLGTHECMKTVSPGEVIAAVEKFFVK